jgi:hypothetical protein
MATLASVRALERFGRTRLSTHFFMRDFLFSEIAAIEGLPNLPANPALAVEVGSMLCQTLLEPLQATFGRIAIRSAYRSPQVNAFGNAHKLSCASNHFDRARHIWDMQDDLGKGAMTTIVVPWFIERYEAGQSWTAMGWWIHDHLPYSELQFFPRLAAFNISWHEVPRKTIRSFVPPRGLLTAPSFANFAGLHARAYPGFPRLVHESPRTRYFPA